MARISSYGQDGTVSKTDKVLGTDSETGATKNYTVDSLLGLVNDENLVEAFDGAAFEFQNYVDPANDPEGVINLNASTASNASFSAINTLYISIKDKSGSSLVEYLENADNDFIKISKTDNLNQFGIYEVTAIADYGNAKYKKLTLTPRGTNGTLTVGTKYFVANYSALYEQDFSDRSVTDFQDVSLAGSGKIITDDERGQLQSLNANALVHNDVVDNLASTATDVPLSANQGKILKSLIDAINTLLEVDSDDAPALDTLREIVNFCQTNASTLSALTISSISGLQAALNLKQNSESGKGLSANDFTTILKDKLDSIADNAQVNVKPNWTAAAGTDTEILNKPADLTVLSSHSVEDLSDVTSAGSGAIITGAERDRINPSEATFIGLSSAERIKLAGIDVNATTRVVTDGTDSITVPPQNAQANVKANWTEDNADSDAFIRNKPIVASSSTTLEISGTANEIEVDLSGAQDLTANRAWTIGLPDDVTIGDDLTVTNKVNVGGPIEFTGIESTTPTFDNGLYYSTDDAHDTLHFRYHGHDLSIDYLTQNIPTGILAGGELAKVDATTFSIAAGDGVINILNKGVADPHPEIKKIEWSAQNITHTEGDSGDSDQINTWIYINSSGTVVQTTTFPGPGVWRDNIVIGSVVHSSDIIRFTKTFPRPSYSTGNTYAEFAEIFGPLKKSGHLITANTTNTLRIDRSAGVSFALGRNYTTDAENPSIVDDGASTPVFHRYSTTSTGFTKDDGTNGAGYTDLDPTKYDNNGTLTSVNSAKFSVQRLYHFPNNTGVIVSYYGKAEYQSVDDAEKNYLLENFQEADNTAGQAIYLGAIIVKGNATDLTDSGQAKILTAGIFRSLASTNLGGVAIDSALNDLTDVNISSVANDQVLKYNSSTAQWENQAEGGSIDGTGATNRLAVWSDTDTLTNDDSLRWDSGNERLSVGIGVGSSTLHAYSASDDTIATFQSGDATSKIAFRDINTLAGTQPSIGGVGNDTVFTRGNTESMRIKSDGNVGIGTGSPGYKLDVHNGTVSEGIARFSGADSDDMIFVSEDGYMAIDTRNTASGLSFQIQGSDKVRISPNGNVGIGTDQPEVSLDLGNNTDALQLPAGDNTARGNIANPFGGMIRYNTTDNQFEGYSGVGAAGSWGAIGGASGGGSSEIVKETFNGTGSQADFALGDAIADIDNINVYVNGVYQYPSNYTVSGNTVTFVSGSIPASGTNNVHVRHNVTAPTLTEGAAFSTSGNLTGDGSTTTFALGGSPRSSDHVMVFLEGVYQEKENYSISGSNIIFNTAPPSGYSIEVKFMTGVMDLASVGEVTLREYVGNGNTATYALGTTPTSEAYVDAYIEGVYQEKGTYSVSGSNILFDSNIPNGYSIELKTIGTIPTSSVTQTTFVSDEFTANGSTNNFTLVNGAPTSKSLTMVFIQGVYQAKSNYNLASGEIQFTAGTPEEDDVIEVVSMSAVNTAGSPVTSVNGEVGAVTVSSDVTSVNGSTGAVVLDAEDIPGVVDTSDDTTGLTFWTGTQAEYDALTTYDSTKLYFIT